MSQFEKAVKLSSDALLDRHLPVSTSTVFLGGCFNGSPFTCHARYRLGNRMEDFIDLRWFDAGKRHP